VTEPSHPTEPERPTEPEPESPHRHTWRGYEFAFDGEHPVAEQRCHCGAARTIRAWERYWDPSGSVQGQRNEPPAAE
jgi:hypothetical protein